LAIATMSALIACAAVSLNWFCGCMTDSMFISVLVLKNQKSVGSVLTDGFFPANYF
jgi:hypothetical protein